jgi:hypothetical protein
MQFDRLKRDGFPTLLGGVAPAGPLGKRAPQSPSDRGARTPDRPIHVLILIPTLNVGGAEMDLLRTVPRIDPCPLPGHGMHIPGARRTQSLNAGSGN